VRRDAIFYQLFQRCPSLLFTLLDLDPRQSQGYRFESVEVKEPTFRIDGVLLPPPDAQPQIIGFGEVQFQKDDTLYYRFFGESFLYLYRNPRRFDQWYGIIIFLSRSLEPDDTRIHQVLLDSPHIKRIYLDELTAEQSASLGIRLMQLTVLPEPEMATQAREIITTVQQTPPDILSPDEIIEIVTTIVVYKFTTLSREEVEAMLGLTGTTLEETRVYRDAKEEGVQQGLQQGLQQGQEQVLAVTVPLLLQAGLTIEQIAQQTGIDLAVIRRVAEGS